jgi:gliding motility-associated-like protein
MIKQLSIHRLLLLLVAALIFNTAKAQVDTLKSPYAPTTAVFNINSSINNYISFKITNTNSYPIKITDVLFYHLALLNVGGKNVSYNGASYTLYSTKTAMAGAPDLTNTTAWKIEAAGNPITTASNGKVPVLENLNIIVPGNNCTPDNEIRFALVMNDSFYHYTTAPVPTPGPATPMTPATITQAGVVMSAGSSNEFTGTASPFFSSPVNNIQAQGASGIVYVATGFFGNVVFTSAPSAIVPPAPKLTVTVNPICKGDTTVIKATMDASTCAFPNPVFTWTWPGGGPVTGDSLITPKLTQTTTFSCVVSSGVTTSAPSSVKIVVNAPEPPQVSGKFAYCVNDQFEPVTVAADSALWYYTSLGGAPLPVAPTINTSLGPQKDTFYVAQWKNGCVSDRTRVTFSAANIPVAPIVESPLYKCMGEPSIPLEAIGQNLVWYYFPTGGIPSVVPPTPPTSVGDTFAYYVTQDNDGCQGPRAQIDVFVVFKPNGLIVPSREQICMGDTVTFTYYGSAFEGSAYIWEVPKSAISVNPIAGPGPVIVQFNEPGSYDFLLQVGNGDCFSPKYTQTIQVDSIPTATITAKQRVCEGVPELVSLQNYDESIDLFTWSFGAGSSTSHYSTGQGPYGVTWNEPGERVIELIIRDGACADTLYDTIEVRPLPDASIVADVVSPTGVYCSGDSIRVRANTIDGGNTYKWGPDRYFDEYSNLSAAYAIVDFSSYLKLTVNDQFGCEKTDSLFIKTEACCKLTFPTAFSPNADGRNDRFHLLNVNNMDNYNRTNALNYDVKTFRVLNRWGVTVFESNNEISGWDGTFNGEPQDLGTYFWFISYMCDGTIKQEKGEVMLVR